MVIYLFSLVALLILLVAENYKSSELQPYNLTMEVVIACVPFLNTIILAFKIIDHIEW